MTGLGALRPIGTPGLNQSSKIETKCHRSRRDTKISGCRCHDLHTDSHFAMKISLGYGSPRNRRTHGTKSEVGTIPWPSREPKKGQKCYVTLAFWWSLAKGTKSKVAELGARTKLWMCSPKEYHQKKFRRNGVSASKNTLKTPPQTIF